MGTWENLGKRIRFNYLCSQLRRCRKGGTTPRLTGCSCLGAPLGTRRIVPWFSTAPCSGSSPSAWKTVCVGPSPPLYFSGQSSQPDPSAYGCRAHGVQAPNGAFSGWGPFHDALWRQLPQPASDAGPRPWHAPSRNNCIIRRKRPSPRRGRGRCCVVPSLPLWCRGRRAARGGRCSRGGGGWVG